MCWLLDFFFFVHYLSYENCLLVTLVWDTMKNPVLYGLGAALLVALLSIVLGLIVSRCCFSRNLMHTPRSKLMDLEMDWAIWPKTVAFFLLMWPHFTLTHFRIAWLLMSLENVLSHKYSDMCDAHCLGLFHGRKWKSLLLACTQEDVVAPVWCTCRISGLPCWWWPHPP